jgi:type IV pilus assembly protein PilC
MRFAYNAKNKDGKVVKDYIEATDEKTAIQSLKDSQLFVIDIKAKDQNKGASVFQQKVGLKEKIIFTQQLAMMIRSGLSVTEALEALRDESQNKSFITAINKVMLDVKGGTTLSEAFSKHPAIFSNIYCNMTKAGEQSGKLDMVLDRLSSQLEKDYDLNRKVRGALSYPIFVMFALIIVMVLIITVIIPQLKSVFDDAGVALPATTRAIIWLSDIFQKYGIYLLIIVGGLIGGFIWALKKRPFRKILDRLYTKIPVIGPLLVKTYISRFSRTFASLVASGMPVLDAITTSSGVVGNIIYSDELIKLVDKVKNGQSVSSAMKQSPLFPRMVSQLSTVGEKSGNLSEVFDKIADFFDRDIDNTTANLSSMLEPVIMVVMGVGIGFIVVSVLQPMYGLVNAI